MATLHLDDVSLAAGGTRLVAGLTLEVSGGSVLFVHGRSGTGKTTLLRTIAGLIDAAAGAITLDGQTPAALGWPAFRSRVTYLAQQPAFHEESVEDALRRPFRFRARAGAAFDRAQALAVLEALDLDGSLLAREAGSLSVGQQQRVALTRLLLTAPDVILLDEPTSALDPESVDAVVSVLAHARKDGAALVVVTHDRNGLTGLGEHRTLDLADYVAVTA